MGLLELRIARARAESRASRTADARSFAEPLAYGEGGEPEAPARVGTASGSRGRAPGGLWWAPLLRMVPRSDPPSPLGPLVFVFAHSTIPNFWGLYEGCIVGNPHVGQGLPLACTRPPVGGAQGPQVQREVPPPAPQGRRVPLRGLPGRARAGFLPRGPPHRIPPPSGPVQGPHRLASAAPCDRSSTPRSTRTTRTTASPLASPVGVGWCRAGGMRWVVAAQGSGAVLGGA